MFTETHHRSASPSSHHAAAVQRLPWSRPSGTAPIVCATRTLAILLATIVSLWLTACASLPTEVRRIVSHALPAAFDTPLGRISALSVPDRSATGFRLMPTPEFALNARLELAQRAQRSLDLQYYVIHGDSTGRYLLRLLRDAAARGVRVRLLLDDLNTSGEDDLLVALAAHDNVEVRLFNPFPYGRSSLHMRHMATLLDFDRLNHRMHNKLFIADSAMAVAGGRNIGDEYFLRDAGANFIDLDTFVAGKLVTRLGALFDEYWNSRHSYPISRVVRGDDDKEQLRLWFDRETRPSASPPPEPPPASDLLGHASIGAELADGRLRLAIATAEAYADSPEKVGQPRHPLQQASNPELDSVLYNVRLQVRNAKDEVAETSPYLVPGQDGMESMRLLRKRGVKFSIVTNSLAATDELVVYTGYRRYRTEMLELGVDLYELSPNRVRKNTPRFGKYGQSIGRLHAKCAVIDRKTVFVGSLNFDPRSDKHNTEMGLFIHSAELAQELLRLMEFVKLDGSYQLRLASDGSRRVEWVIRSPDGEEVLTSEPETTPWRQLLLNVLTPFTPEDLL